MRAQQKLPPYLQSWRNAGLGYLSRRYNFDFTKRRHRIGGMQQHMGPGAGVVHEAVTLVMAGEKCAAHPGVATGCITDIAKANRNESDRNLSVRLAPAVTWGEFCFIETVNAPALDAEARRYARATTLRSIALASSGTVSAVQAT